jgi:hypothetical protein
VALLQALDPLEIPATKDFTLRGFSCPFGMGEAEVAALSASLGHDLTSLKIGTANFGAVKLGSSS